MEIMHSNGLLNCIITNLYFLLASTNRLKYLKGRHCKSFLELLLSFGFDMYDVLKS